MHSGPTAAVSPPAPGLPLGVNFDLGTRWGSLPTSIVPSVGDFSRVSMSSDSTVWAAAQTQSGGPGTLYEYDPHGGVWYKVWTAPAPIVSIAAAQVKNSTSGKGIERQVWVVYGTTAATTAVLIDQYGGYGGSMMVLQTTSLPGNDTFLQIAAGADGTTWALDDTGQLYSYNGRTRNTWTPQSSGGQAIMGLSVGSAANVWALAFFPAQQSHFQLIHLVNNAWQPAPTMAGLTTNFAATADGTVWAAPMGGGLYTLPAGQSAWVKVGHQTPPKSIDGLAAGSRYRAVALSNSGLGLLTYGLADQPATGYPQWTGGKLKAYNYISQQLGITAPGGIRFEYTNQFAVNDLPIYQATLLGLAPAPGVSARDWNAVKSEVLQEISAVLAVYQVFNEIDSLDQWVAFEATSLLSQTSDLVQLSTGNQSTEFGVIFQQFFSAGLAGIAKALTGGAGIAASVIASGINSAVSDVTNGGSNQVFNTTYYQLQTQLNTIFVQAHAANSAYKGAILADPGRFLPVLAGINNGTLYWPTGSNQKLATSADNAFQAYFLQVLAPLRWQIHVITDFDVTYINQFPSYDRYFVPNHPGGSTGTLYSLSRPQSLGYEYPLPALLQTITQVTGASLGDVLTNKLGWFKFHVN